MSVQNGKSITTWDTIYNTWKLYLSNKNEEKEDYGEGHEVVKLPDNMKSQIILKRLIEFGHMVNFGGLVDCGISVSVDLESSITTFSFSFKDTSIPKTLNILASVLSKAQQTGEDKAAALSLATWAATLHKKSPRGPVAPDATRAVGLRLYDLHQFEGMKHQAAQDALRKEISAMDGPGKAAVQVIAEREYKELHHLFSQTKNCVESGEVHPMGKKSP